MSTVSSGNFGPGAFGAGGFGEEEDSGASGGVAGALTLFVLAVSAIAMWMGADAQRVLLTASLSMILFGLINFSAPAGISATVFYLSVLGGLKRYMIPILGYSNLDPLLLVAPVVVSLFFINRMIRRDIPRDTKLAKMTFAFLIILFLEVFNPLQGGITIGVASAMYYIVPLIWFYIGRSFGTRDTQNATFKMILFVSLLGVIYGMYQQFVGLTDVEKEWLRITGNDRALYVEGGVHRVFSFFSSFSEYAHFVIYGLIISFVIMLRQNRMAVVVFAVFLIALVLSSSRGALLNGVFCLAVIWAVQGKEYRSWGWRLVVAAIFGVLALFYGLSSAKNASFDATTEALVEHQARGILSPLEKKTSTGGDHLTEIMGGITIGIRNPIGNGLGATTIVGGKFADAGPSLGLKGEGVGTEADYSNVFVSCGAIGGVLYLVMIGYVIWRAARRWHLQRDNVSITTLSMLMGSLGFWLQGAHYAETMIIWFLIGSLDRHDHQEMLREAYQKWKESGGAKQVPARQQRPQRIGQT